MEIIDDSSNRTRKCEVRDLKVKLLRLTKGKRHIQDNFLIKWRCNAI